MTLTWQNLKRAAAGFLSAIVALVTGACEHASSDPVPSESGDSTVVSIVSSSATSGATLSIPRYKIYQDEDDPERLWVGFEVERGPDTFVSEDGGRSWHPIDAMGWEYHMSMAGNPDGYVHFINRGTPSATYHRLHGRTFQPGLRAEFADYDGKTTTGNVSVNGDEVVAGTGNPVHRHRIGSCVIDGEITLVYWQGGGSESGMSDAITLYRWTGTEFARIDHSYTTSARHPLTREYAVTQDSSGLIHLATWDVVDEEKVVRHATRTLDSDWSAPQTVARWDNDNIFPQLSAYRGGVVLVYRYNPNSSESEDAQAYYRTWSPETGWTNSGIRVSAPSSRSVRSPMAPQHVAPGSPFVPVMWAEGEFVKYKALEVQ